MVQPHATCHMGQHPDDIDAFCDPAKLRLECAHAADLLQRGSHARLALSSASKMA